jgi:GTP pyrophosphokinase
MFRIGEIVDMVLAYYPEADAELLERAYIYSAVAHRGQLRTSGEPYLSHPLEVAGILAKMRMDVTTIVAGLLHDVPEDTGTSIADIEARFGRDVAELVEGVTKIGKMAFSTKVEREAENFRKMVLAMAKDIRVILIKLADRLHNMRTIDPLPEAKRRRIAQETLEIYAPLANRLGIAWMKVELEDLAFRQLHPAEYDDVSQRVAKKHQEQEAYIEQVQQLIQERLAEAEVPAEVSGRAKHFYGIWGKMLRQNIPFDQVYDIIAVRIITDTVRNCYAVLGTIHSLWTPVPGRFKDYIAMPKANGYQSLHTTVIGPGGERVEFQIRTREMHAIAQHGVAAHWKYKEGFKGESRFDASQQWLKGLLEWQKELKDPREFLETVKVDLFPDEVYAFTPRGDVRALPRGATPVDFAYAVHTDVGHRCVGAKVNGRIVPLRYQIVNGDIIEILTQAGHVPSKDWLKFVKTSRAKARIKSWIKNEQRAQSVTLGRELLEKELRKSELTTKALKSPEFAAALAEIGLRTPEEAFAAIGYGKLAATQVVGRMLPPEAAAKRDERKDSKIRDFVKRITGKRVEESVRIGGLEGALTRFAQCCNPVPGDKIVGFITRGRGVTVHAADCPNAEPALLDRDRLVAVDWDLSAEQSYPVRILVEGRDKPGLLAAITGVIAEAGVNIAGGKVTTDGGRGLQEFELGVKNLEQLRKLMEQIRRLKGVMRVERLRASTAGPEPGGRQG